MIIGGGRSSWEEMVILARTLIEPTLLMALQTTISPLSLRDVFGMVSTESPSVVNVVSKRSNLFPGKMIERFPSMDQNSIGLGFPEDLHSKDASEVDSTVRGSGRITNAGGAVRGRGQLLIGKTKLLKIRLTVNG